MKGRDYSLDLIRILACFMVVLMHSPLPAQPVYGPFLVGLSYMSAPCIGLFFMVSGALLMPVRTDSITFLKKRFGKIVIPTVIWTIIYLSLKLYYSQSWINIFEHIVSMPFVPNGNGVLWFMYTLAGLYLLAPILSSWVEKASKKEVLLVLSLWVITLCYPLLNFIVSTNSSTSGVLYYFAGYAGYFLLGYYLKKYPKSISAKIMWCIAISGVVLLVYLKHFKIYFEFYKLFWYESIFIASLAGAIWKSVRGISAKIKENKVSNSFWYKIKKAVGLLSNVSFGIYLIHILIMRHWLWNESWIKSISYYPLQTFTIALLTMTISAGVCILISKLAFSQWIIGFSNRSHR